MITKIISLLAVIVIDIAFYFYIKSTLRNIENKILKFTKYMYINDITMMLIVLTLNIVIGVITMLFPLSPTDYYIISFCLLFIFFISIYIIKENSEPDSMFEYAYPKPPTPKKYLQEYSWKLRVCGFYNFSNEEIEDKINVYLDKKNIVIVKGEAKSHFEVYLLKQTPTFEEAKLKLFLQDLKSKDDINMFHLETYSKFFKIYSYIVISIILMYIMINIILYIMLRI